MLNPESMVRANHALTREHTNELFYHFFSFVFPFPKPVGMIADLISWYPRKDIIVLDAFLGQYIPFPFMSLEFAYASRKILKDKGVISINACNGHPFFEPHVKTLNEVYGDNVYSLDGQSNPYTTTIYACKENTKPSSGIYLPSNYYSDRCPVKINLTDGIKNSKILSLKNV